MRAEQACEQNRHASRTGMRAELEQELGGLGAEADSRLCSDTGNSTFSLEAYLSKLRQLPYVQVPRHVLVVLVKRPPA